MHKFYKPYMYGTILIAVLLSTYTLISYEVELNLLAVLIVTFGMMLEVIMLRYSQNSSISLHGAVTIFAVFEFNPVMCVLIITSSFILETVVNKIIKHEYLFNSSSKALYNWTMRIISILAAEAAVTLLEGWNTIILIIAAASLYNIINASLLVLIIFLYTNNKEAARIQSIQSVLSCIYLSILISILQYYGYKAYGINAIIVIYMFLLPLQTSLLRKAVEQEIEESVLMDSLTKVFNKASLSNILTDYLNIKRPFTIIFIDFDNFKIINSTYGHDVGDKILLHFANTLKESLRKTDKLYRFGGDEFCLVIDKECDVDVVIEKTNKLKDNLVYDEGRLKIPYTFSMGKYKYNGNYNVTEDEIISIVSHRMIQNKINLEEHKV